MNPGPENNFKKFIISILLIFFVIIVIIIKPIDLEKIKEADALKLSAQKPWVETSNEQYIDDVDVDMSILKENLEENNTNQSFGIEFNTKEPLDEFWVTGSIPLIPMSDLNGKSRIEILTQRKLYVENTIFKNRRYVPSEGVFGLMDNTKPWIGIESFTCYGNGAKTTYGLSKDSRFLNNPVMLVGLDREGIVEQPKKNCSPADYLLPVKINYSKDNNMIKVVFELSQNSKNMNNKFTLNGINARDLKFRYAYADSTSNVIFNNNEFNISNNIYEFKDFITVDNSCGIKGGCNNINPVQNELKFSINNYPAKIHIKLWKTYPKNKNIKADINYMIVLK